MKNSSNYQALTYTMLSIVVLSVFSVRSYAFLDQALSYKVILSIFAPLLFAAAMRPVFLHFFVNRKHALGEPKRQFLIDMGLYLAVSMTLFVMELVWFTGSGMLALKMFVLCLMTGYFASLDMALDCESRLFAHAKYNEIVTGTENISVAQRLNLFFSVTLLIAIFVCGLFAYSYMNMAVSVENIKEAFIIDMFFIVSIFVSLTVRLTYAYSQNLRTQFDQHINGLDRIREGELDEYVPVMSNDEFGKMSLATNSLIDQLREKRKIQKTLEEIVSPDIMQKLLNGDRQELKEGQDIEVAVLFCDLRKFTTFAENTPSEEVIFFLNAYFTKVADIVSEHHGIINKFMGDAILAVYGVDGRPDYIQQAMNTAWDILLHSQTVKMRDGTEFDIGIGVHRGKATACTLGSTERYEYTFIGDTVNTASRLDGLSKDLGYRLVTSVEVYKDLDIITQERFTDLGMQEIRGKSTTIHVFGANPKKKRYEGNVVPLNLNNRPAAS